MSYVLLRTSAFIRDARRVVRRRPELEDQLRQALTLLADDPHTTHLKTHKLKGKHKDSYACSAGYDLRVVFSFTKHSGKFAILLEAVGTHDEVY